MKGKRILLAFGGLAVAAFTAATAISLNLCGRVQCPDEGFRLVAQFSGITIDMTALRVLGGSEVGE